MVKPSSLAGCSSASSPRAATDCAKRLAAWARITWQTSAGALPAHEI